MDTPSQGTEKTLRTAQERDIEYSKCATLAGDKVFKIQMLNAEVNGLHQAMSKLVTEEVLPEETKAS